MGGGDLLNLLIERDVFDEDFTRFYVSEVINLSSYLQNLTRFPDDSRHRELSSSRVYPQGH